jgi:beta-N-acetylhexosaminidase
LWVTLFFLFPSGCAVKNSGAPAAEPENDEAVPEQAGADPFAADRERAARIAASLDDRLLAAQVIISGIDGRGALTPDMRVLLGECPAGGILLFRYNLDTENRAIQNLIDESAAFIASQIRIAAEGEPARPGIFPFAAVDHEGGQVNRFNPGVAALPAALAYWELAQREGQDQALARVEADSFRADAEMKALGINLNLAPLAEPLTVDNRDFLEDRSYGPDPDFTVQAAAAFIRGMGQAGLLCAIKHFPGSAGPDPHRFPSILGGGKAALDALAAPFAALIRNGEAGALMVSHTLVPARDSENIASLSPLVMGDWLRHELGFGGIIISDDFSMSAAADKSAALDGANRRLSPEAAALRSLAAGADMILVWPPDIRRTHRLILRALDEGGLSRNRLREAAARIIFEKIRMGLLDEK